MAKEKSETCGKTFSFRLNSQIESWLVNAAAKSGKSISDTIKGIIADKIKEENRMLELINQLNYKIGELKTMDTIMFALMRRMYCNSEICVGAMNPGNLQELKSKAAADTVNSVFSCYKNIYSGSDIWGQTLSEKAKAEIEQETTEE